MAIKMEVWGPYACFTNPAMKVERTSYDCPTPSAARGMLEAVFWHPGLTWRIDRIHILNPIEFTNIRRNEVKAKLLATSALSAMKGNAAPLYIATSKEIQQRASLMLKDVHYVIEAHFDMVPDRAGEGDNPGKFQDIIKRRLRKGACFSQPYLGCRELSAHFGLWEKGEIRAIDETRELGYMLYDIDYADPENPQPMFFRAKLVDGVLDLADCEVRR